MIFSTIYAGKTGVNTKSVQSFLCVCSSPVFLLSLFFLAALEMFDINCCTYPTSDLYKCS